MTGLERELGHSFSNEKLLETALTHSSYANENRRSGAECNERLEFLGDAILGVTVAEQLFKGHPELPEGDMTRLRSELVCEESLHETADRLGLGAYLRLGRGEESTGGRARASILADAMEAVIAAVYLDGGDARALISRLILEPFEKQKLTAAKRDYKTALQELVQRENGRVLSYETVGESGPDHAKSFTVTVLLNGAPLASGEGRSKKEAEQAAAKLALEDLSNDA